MKLLYEIKPQKAKFAFKGNIADGNLFSTVAALSPFVGDYGKEGGETWLEIKTTGIGNGFEFTIYTNDETTASELRELNTVLPYTVLIFAQARIRRLQMELDRAIDQGYVPTV